MTKDDMVGWHHQLDGHQFEHGTWLWTGKPGVLQFMGSQRVRYDLAIEQQQQNYQGNLYMVMWMYVYMVKRIIYEDMNSMFPFM